MFTWCHVTGGRETSSVQEGLDVKMKDDKSKCKRAIILLLPFGFLLVTIAVHLRTYFVGNEIGSQPKPIPSPSKYLSREPRSSWSPTTDFPVLRSQYEDCVSNGYNSSQPN